MCVCTTLKERCTSSCHGQTIKVCESHGHRRKCIGTGNYKAGTHRVNWPVEKRGGNLGKGTQHP